jgi:hypothetical protein
VLERIDRVLLSVRDARETARAWQRLLDAEIERQDEVPALAARRVVVRVGDAELEILEPAGPGLVADHVASGRGGPFAAGAAARDVPALAARLAARGIRGVDMGDQVFYDGHALGIAGLNLMISPVRDRARVGLMANLYEVTHLTDSAAAAAGRLAECFALDSGAFVPIRSETYGYDGVLTLFHGDALHRIETITPFDREKTMGRYFTRHGPSLYMCYGETDRLPEIRARLVEHAPHDWTGSVDNDDGLFIHPKALGGVMLGVSRTTYAWTWSGHPERVRSLE